MNGENTIGNKLAKKSDRHCFAPMSLWVESSVYKPIAHKETCLVLLLLQKKNTYGAEGRG